MTGKEALGVFARTFLVLAGSVLLAVQGLEWADGTLIGNNVLTLGLGGWQRRLRRGRWLSEQRARRHAVPR